MFNFVILFFELFMIFGFQFWDIKSGLVFLFKITFFFFFFDKLHCIIE